MVFHWSLSDSKSPQIFRTLLSILAVLYNVVVWIIIIIIIIIVIIICSSIISTLRMITWNQKIAFKLIFVLDKNTWNYITMYKIFVLRIVTWSYNCL